MNRTMVERRIQSATEERKISSNCWLVAPGVWRLKDLFVNVYIIQNKEGSGWVMVDAGLASTAAKVRILVAELFGKTSLPKAIILTHAHFDHRGSLLELAEEWKVPVYCHHMEKPYLTGQASYPPADPSVGGGAMALISFAYPRRPIQAENYLRELREDGRIDELVEWQWIHTPGHTPGHISLFRERDGVLVAGDAVVTTLQESLISVATQAKIVCGPPKYFTPDWGSSARSVKVLAALEPNVLATGHGQAMYGEQARKQLHKHARDFWQKGMPATGRYVKEPVEYNEAGHPVHIPPPSNSMWKKLAVATVLFTLGYLIARQGRGRSFIQKRLLGRAGATLKIGALGALGATAPASAALPSLPLVPML